MPYRNTFMNSIQKYLDKGQRSYSEPFDFREKNKTEINNLIMNNKISNSEFTIIKSAVDKFIDEYIPLNSTQAKLEEILKSYIVLALNNNSRIDKYLNKFDCDTAYYKKIKAISLIKFYN